MRSVGFMPDSNSPNDYKTPQRSLLKIRNGLSMEELDDHESLNQASYSDSRVPTNATYSRSPSTPRSRQGSLSNLKLNSPFGCQGEIYNDKSSGSASRGRFNGTYSSSEDLKLCVDSPGFGQSPPSRGISSRHKLNSPNVNTGSTKKSNKKRRGFHRNSFFFMVSLLMIYFLLDWWVLSRLRVTPDEVGDANSIPLFLQGEWSRFPKGERPRGIMYSRLLSLAAHALAEDDQKPEPKELWKEPLADASAWKPCAHQRDPKYGPFGVIPNNTGFIMISANGGLNQQRVAICNGVAVARLLNATLVIPRFQLSSVWQDSSQFGDIYQENFFIDYLKNDVRIVRELPPDLQSLDLEAIGSFITDIDIMKEAKPSYYVKHILPILLRNRVVHFFGFGNRLSFDPIPFDIQRLRCKCNFHALKFHPKIQRTGAVLVKRMREQITRWGPEVDEDNGGSRLHISQTNALRMLVDDEHSGNMSFKGNDAKYLGLHLRFEIDMAAYSLCEFGGGEAERKELEAYREIYFPTLSTYKKNAKLLSASQLREDGQCPLTPEEAVLMLVGLGFKRQTRIFLAGAHIYGGQSRMVALTSLYPNLVTKEDLLSPSEIEPFLNKSSQLAALDFIGCAAADVFAMTDSGSQLSSLVSGYRVYYGAGRLPTIRPNKRRLASIFSKNSTIEWEEFQERVRKTVKESKRVQVRPIARSVYRHPRCPECMCKVD